VTTDRTSLFLPVSEGNAELLRMDIGAADGTAAIARMVDRYLNLVLPGLSPTDGGRMRVVGALPRPTGGTTDTER
jgi:hypothetical protein